MSKLYVRQVESPLGTVTLVAGDLGLCRLDFDVPERRDLTARRIAFAFPEAAVVSGESCADLNASEQWLTAYFAGNSEPFAGKLNLVGSPFEESVWAALLDIPIGVTTTYAKLADLIGCSAPRAVGTAVGKNPISLIVPCHRVIGSDGSLTGYAGGLDRKQWLLQHEGALLSQPALF